ncbi:DUF2188 domain-containing protein [Cupriavidus consociatus]|uniref:DUF2188 domain-containing protein n=1 Tax=Cupriavidus consociatus TaxID=2821357 RepID=UPI001AEAAA0B|nr:MULTISPECIES: DUF2188 domain-containing protein [unclassified Cupriavidus]MBP0620833.1 DUF2188 domain-containing protein [Cupriavidus sp. LEh25]MDK2657494.1 DUF2188 domain-containing protein [Cupriavidus sp. LEh21]
MPSDDIHVVPVGDRWTVETQGVGRETFETQDEAIASGTERAREQHAELLIHGRDGQIRERNSFGNDPRDITG